MSGKKDLEFFPNNFGKFKSFYWTRCIWD